MRVIPCFAILAMLHVAAGENLRHEPEFSGEDMNDTRPPQQRHARHLGATTGTGDRSFDSKGDCVCYGECPTHQPDCAKDQRSLNSCTCGGCACCDGEWNPKGTKCCKELNEAGTKCNGEGEQYLCSCEDKCECIRECQKSKGCKTATLKTECPCDKKCECDECRNTKCTKYTKTWCECEEEGGGAIIGWGRLSPFVLWGTAAEGDEPVSGYCGKGRCHQTTAMTGHEVAWDTPCGSLDQDPCPATMWDASTMSRLTNEYTCGKCYQMHWRNEYYWNQDAYRSEWFLDVDAKSTKDQNFAYNSYVPTSCPDKECADRRIDLIIKIVGLHSDADIRERSRYVPEYDQAEYWEVDIGLGQNGWNKVCKYLCPSGQCVEETGHCSDYTGDHLMPWDETLGGYDCGTQNVPLSVYSLPRTFHWAEVNCTDPKWVIASAAAPLTLGFSYLMLTMVSCLAFFFI